MSAMIMQPAGWGHLREWISPGPTIDRFISSLNLSDDDLRDIAKRTAKKVRVLQGPIGSGKTTGILGGCAVNAQRQPTQNDKIRHYNLTIARTDYRLLWSSFIKPFWFRWFPDNSPWTEWRGAEDQPGEHTIRLNSQFGRVMWHVSFRAIDPNTATPEKISNFWRGQLPTDLWLEEADAFSESIYQGGYSRVGRFPEMHQGGPTSPTLYLGTNAPLSGWWMHTRLDTGRWKRDQQYFNQPSGRSAEAENRHNLPPGYYDEMIAELEEDMIARLIDNEFVMPRAGKPVHPEYRDSLHGASTALKPDPRLELLIGIDPRTRPSLVICQREPGGQWRFLNEIVGDPGMGSQRFAERINEMLARAQYAPWRRRHDMIRCVVDPSAAWGADRDAGEQNWLERVAGLTHLDIRPAQSNKAKDRRDGMKAALRRLTDGGRPGATFSTECPILRAALGGMFHYAEINLQGMGSGKGVSAEPVKNEYADVAEAAEYATMEFGGLEDASLPAGAAGGGEGKYKNFDDYAEG